MDGFDNNPTARDILGDKGYKKYLQEVSETVDNTDSMIYRYSAELSSRPEPVVAVAPTSGIPSQWSLPRLNQKTQAKLQRNSSYRIPALS
jgi:hypothetical protein